MKVAERASWTRQPHQAWLKPKAAQGFQQSECTLIAPTKKKLTLVSSHEESDKGTSPLHFQHHCLENNSDPFSTELNHTSPTHLLLPPHKLTNDELFFSDTEVGSKKKTGLPQKYLFVEHCTAFHLTCCPYGKEDGWMKILHMSNSKVTNDFQVPTVDCD